MIEAYPIIVDLSTSPRADSAVVPVESRQFRDGTDEVEDVAYSSEGSTLTGWG